MRYSTDLLYLKKLITDSLSYIEKENVDAPLLGGFSGSVIELLGRFMRIHKISGHLDCFGDFLAKYLPKYFPHKNILYRILRCEGVHAVMPHAGVILTCDINVQSYHLQGTIDVVTNLKSLVIYSPEFMKDLKVAVEQFFSDVATDPNLKNNCFETFNEIIQENQKIINKEFSEGRFRIDFPANWKKG